MKKIIALTILVLAPMMGLGFNPGVARAECPVDRVAGVLNLSFQPSIININQSSTVKVSGQVGMWASDCKGVSNTKAYIVYKTSTGEQYKSGPLALKQSGFMGTTLTVTDTISWDKIAKGKEINSDSVTVTAKGVVEGGINFEKNFTAQLKITTGPGDTDKPLLSPKNAEAETPKVTITGNSCKDLKEQISAFGGSGSRAAQLPAYCDVGTVYNKIVDFLYYFIGIIAVLALMYGGFVYMTARENDSQKKKGKDVITYALLGLVIALMALVIVNVVISLIVDNKVS